MPSGSKRQYPGNPHLWKHPNGRWYIKAKSGRRAVGSSDLETAKARLTEYLSTLKPLESGPQSKPRNPAAPLLWQHSSSGIFYIVYRDTNGRRTRKTTGTRDAAEARAVFDRYLAALDAPEKPKNVTVAAIMQGYLADHTPNVSAPDSLRYSAEAVISEIGNLYPRQLSDAQLRRYAAARLALGKKPGTIARDVQILRSALKWATRQDPQWIDAAPVFRMPVKASPPRDRWLTRDEAARLVDACTFSHLRLFVLLALHTTKRSSAILGLRWINIRDGFISFGAGTGNKRRGDVPINATLTAALDEARKLATTPYVIEYGSCRVLSIKNGFKAACQRAGLSDVTPHVLRHTGATWMAAAGIPMEEIARVLGNSVAICEKVYAKYHPDYLRRAVAALEAA